MICPSCSSEIDERETCPDCGAATVLEGRYVLREAVGRGGMGTTYRADRRDDGATVAIKQLPVHQMDSVKAMELFEREASVLEQLDHPGIPDCYEDFSAGEGRQLAVYLVQEFIDGETLEGHLDGYPMGAAEVRETMGEVLEIFEYLHGLDPPVIHRDVKPSNIMRRRASGRLVLIDFGSVRSVLEPEADGGSTVAGTFGYMAPEQFTGRASPATDIYGLAATAVALLAGKPAREMMDHDQTLQWRAEVDVDPAFADLLDEMLATRLEDRPADAASVAERLEQVRVTGGLGSQSAPAPAGDLQLPAPPREVPDDLLEQYGTRAGYRLKFGGMFGGFSSLFLFFGVIKFSVDADQGLGDFLFAMSIPLLFVTIGGWFFITGWWARRELMDVYRNGRATEGRITQLHDPNYSVNDQSPLRMYYEFEVGDEVYTGEFDSFEATRGEVSEGEAVTVLYDPEAPERNMMVRGGEIEGSA